MKPEAWGARLLGLGPEPLILASESPRRVSLLASLGVPFEQRPVGLPEIVNPGESPREAAMRLAEEKARGAVRPGEDALVLGADTLVVLEDEPLGKPEGPAEARDMLRRLSGRTHEVVTGLALVRSRDGRAVSDAAVTRVRFRPLADREIDILVESGEANDKAGAYGIQGLASLVVASIEGEYFNVVGLPLVLLRSLIARARRS